jgi:prephenate dehydratase
MKGILTDQGGLAGEAGSARRRPKAAAVANGLTILCRNVHDRGDNATIFCIVARGAGEDGDAGRNGTD